ncbi:MAG: type II toxin-antitoxin system PemK/MazF family toxin [Clostridia bacterium]|nr:type II toxin-antitoxin system PemK/MazF family toxin [Clostridia bacterium]
MVNYRWSIFWADLDPVTGSEQGGQRPVLVVSAEEVNQHLPIVTVLPLTSTKPGRRVYPTEVLLTENATGLPKDSLAMAHQIRTIAKSRLGEACGLISDVSIRIQIEGAMGRHLGLPSTR